MSKRFKLKEEMASNAGGVGEYSTPKAARRKTSKDKNSPSGFESSPVPNMYSKSAKYKIVDKSARLNTVDLWQGEHINEIKVNPPEKYVYPLKIVNKEQYEKWKNHVLPQFPGYEHILRNSYKFPFYVRKNKSKSLERYGLTWIPTFVKATGERPLSQIIDKIKQLPKEQQAELRVFLKDKFNISEVKDLFEGNEPSQSDFPIKINSHEQAQVIGAWLQKHGFNIDLDGFPFSSKPLLMPLQLRANGNNITWDTLDEIKVNNPLKYEYPLYIKNEEQFNSWKKFIEKKYPHFQKESNRFFLEYGRVGNEDIKIPFYIQHCRNRFWSETDYNYFYFTIDKIVPNYCEPPNIDLQEIKVNNPNYPYFQKYKNEILKLLKGKEPELINVNDPIQFLDSLISLGYIRQNAREEIIDDYYIKGRYSKDIKESKRTSKEILHKSIKETQLKLDEVNRLIEHTSRVKGELKEGIKEIEYLKRTKDSIYRIQERLQEVLSKMSEIKVNNPIKLGIRPRWRNFDAGSFRSREYYIDDIRFPLFNYKNNTVVYDNNGNGNFTIYGKPIDQKVVNELEKQGIKFNLPHPNKDIPVLSKDNIMVKPYKIKNKL